MKASELIEQLKQLIATYGDCAVGSVTVVKVDTSDDTRKFIIR